MESPESQPLKTLVQEKAVVLAVEGGLHQQTTPTQQRWIQQVYSFLKRCACVHVYMCVRVRERERVYSGIPSLRHQWGRKSSEVSSFQRLKCMQEWYMYLGWEKVSCLERFPQFRGLD